MYHVRTKKISTVQTFPTPNQVEYCINCGKQSPFSQASTTIDWPLRLWPLSAEIASWNFAPNDRQRKRSGLRSAELPWCPVKTSISLRLNLGPLLLMLPRHSHTCPLQVFTSRAGFQLFPHWSVGSQGTQRRLCPSPCHGRSQPTCS